MWFISLTSPIDASWNSNICLCYRVPYSHNNKNPSGNQSIQDEIAFTSKSTDGKRRIVERCLNKALTMNWNSCSFIHHQVKTVNTRWIYSFPTVSVFLFLLRVLSLKNVCSSRQELQKGTLREIQSTKSYNILYLAMHKIWYKNAWK